MSFENINIEKEQVEQYKAILEDWIPSDASIAIAMKDTFIYFGSGHHKISLQIGAPVPPDSVAYKVLQCKEGMLIRLGREPSLEELAKELQLPEEEVSQALNAVCAPVSLHDPVYTDGGDPLMVMDQVRDMKNTEGAWMEKTMLRNAYSALGQREKEILSLRFFDGKTQMEVAGKLGISQAQVSRLEKNAINAMRKSFSVS